jgi:transposase InsO family protein
MHHADCTRQQTNLPRNLAGTRQSIRPQPSRLIYGPARTGPWKTVADVELATLSWVHWHNTSRLHGYLNDVPPAEFEAIFYATRRTDQPLIQ